MVHRKRNATVRDRSVSHRSRLPAKHVAAGSRSLTRCEEDIDRTIAKRCKALDHATGLHDLHARRNVVHGPVESYYILGMSAMDDRIGGRHRLTHVQGTSG